MRAPDGKDVPATHAVREQLQRLVSCPQLGHSGTLTKLLRFVVEETLEGRGDQLKESRLGLEVLDRRADSYDPAADPIVRVQMGRLRAKLRSYYARDGENDRVLIEVPTGTYIPSFRTREANAGRAPDLENGRRDPSELRLAVLPFVNMSPDPGNEYFSDGLTEELINLLARAGRLQVIARTSSFQFKGQARDVREIGRLLDVGKVLEGSVRRSGNRVRVTAQLINVADGCHLWSERYEGEVMDIFAIHEEISLAIRRALETHLVGEKEERPPGKTEGIDAYNHYLKGRFLWNKRTEQGFKAAIDHFGEAIRLDPNFARAYSGLADCHFMLGMSAAEAPDHCMPEAKAAAKRALELDDGLADAHASLAAVKNCYEWDWPAAESGYRRSFALDPSYATAHHWYALFALATSGRLDEAVDELERSIRLDPLSQPILADLAMVHCFRKGVAAAVRQCRRVLELDPHFHRPYWILGLVYSGRGQFRAAEKALRKALELCPGHAFRARIMGALGYCYERWGVHDRGDAIRQELTRLARAHYVPQFDLAQIHAGRGDTESAIDCLEGAVTGRESYAIFLKTWPSFNSLHSEPRFRRLTTQIDPRHDALR